MRTTQSPVRPICSPNLPSVPSRRLISGLSDFTFSSTFALVTPSSSAFSIAKPTHFTRLNHCGSLLRTEGPSGSFEMISGRTM